ncbi:unnamed protein product [Polarella glacialis]|uniref:Ammonium transporter n=1 Tax=Polarella glacialis TaxID=89957 RepID=A0A813J4B9_POLGL|nr:unnamed protein product [Polarella glacialis]
MGLVIKCLVAVAVLASLSQSQGGVGEDVEAKALLSELRALKDKIQARRETLSSQDAQLEGLQAAQRRLQSRVSEAEFETFKSEYHSALSHAWLLLCGALVMLMHAGFSMLEAGCCRAKNTSNVLMKNLVNVCMGTIGWWVFGWALAYGGPYEDDGTLSGKFIGRKEFLGEGMLVETATGVMPATAPNDHMVAWFFQWAFCTAGATIVSGGVAERVQSPSYAIFAFVMAAFIYPVVVAWTWGYGWMYGSIGTLSTGFMDFAGSGIVHLCGGVAALAGTCVLGPRKGRFDPERSEEFEAHSLPLVVLGTFILWFGWYGFNPVSTLSMNDAETGAKAAMIAMNTTLSAATGGITVFTLRYIITRKYDVGGLCNGILAGLVSITAGCSNMESGSAVATGFIGAIIYQLASMLLVKLKIDDPVDASPVHGACGAWGCLAAALFDFGKDFECYHGWGGWTGTPSANAPLKCANGGDAIVAQIVMVVTISVWSLTFASLTFGLMRFTGMLRIDDYTEEVGMDARMHSPGKAYIMNPTPGPPPPPEVAKSSVFI